MGALKAIVNNLFLKSFKANFMKNALRVFINISQF